MRVLIASYAFPPVGGAGVQRVLKLVKYLPEHGVTPVVLTAKNPSVPVVDVSLLAEVPGNVEILRARTFEPGYAAKQLAWNAQANVGSGASSSWRSRLVLLAKSLLIPDPQVLWLPSAAAALSRWLASAGPEDAVLVSGPPFSQFALAALARLRPHTAVVLDYRDEWTTTRAVNEMSSTLPPSLDAGLERLLLRAAHAVTTATEAYRQALLWRFPFLDQEHVHTIENGFDLADFPSDLPGPREDRYVLTYVGTVFRLTSARGLLDGLRLLHEREPELARLLEVRFVGRIVETEARHFEGSEQLGVRQLGYVAHAHAVEELAQCHAALCLLSQEPGAERVYPAKIFEIMGLCRPCLALCPEGALADLVRAHGLGEVVAPGDSEAIAATLIRRLREFRQGRAPTRSSPVDIARFDRRTQAGTFSAVIKDAVARAAATREEQRARRPSPLEADPRQH